MSQATFDIELALHDFSSVEVELRRQLNDKYVLEDRSNMGWGLVLRRKTETRLPLAQALDEFLGPLSEMRSLIATCSPTLRVAAFNPNVTCTVLIPDLTELAAFGLKLEVSVYPAGDDDEP